MRVSLRAEARFYFVIDRGTVDELIDISKRHYDGECQRASVRIGEYIKPGATWVQSKNGVLTIWRDNLWAEDAIEVSAKWDDLDLVAKICEQALSTQTRAVTFAAQIRRMFELAGPKIMKEWKVDFDV